MDYELNQKLLAARQAVERISSYEADRRLAAELPKLEENAVTAQRAHEAATALEEARDRVRKTIGDVLPSIQAAAKRYEAAKAELIASLVALSSVHDELENAARALHSNTSQVLVTQNRTINGTPDPWDVQRLLVSEATVLGSFEREWSSVGGGRTDLEVFDGRIPDEIDRAVLRSLGFNLFRPQYGARHFSRSF